MAALLRAESPSSPSPSDSADDSADDLHLHFPQPPPIAPALRRMRSAPWHFPDAPMPDRRHSAALYPPPPIPPRRLDPLPPPAPAPSIPLPRLPRLIRKVTSMRSEIRQEPVIESHRPIPKVRSLKFLSRSIGVPLSTTQPSEQESRKRSWSFSRPSRFQNPNDAPQVRSSYTNWNVRTGDRFQDMDRMPSDYAGYPVPYHDGFVRQAGCSTEDPFSLGLAPPFVTEAMRESDLNSFYPYSNTNYSEAGSVRNMSSNSPTRDRLLQRSSQRFYRINSSRRKNASSGTLLHGAKSFINITPERGKGGKKKSKPETNGLSDSNGNHVGSSMRERGQKMKRLLARASTGVVDWGRQLTGKSVKSMTTSSTSGSLVPLTGKRS